MKPSRKALAIGILATLLTAPVQGAETASIFSGTRPFQPINIDSAYLDGTPVVAAFGEGFLSMIEFTVANDAKSLTFNGVAYHLAAGDAVKISGFQGRFRVSEGNIKFEGAAAAWAICNHDSDRDGLFDCAERFDHGTDPNLVDTDGDLLGDGEEVLYALTNPLDADTDKDGLGDGAESLTHQTDPLVADTDGGGVLDGEEVIRGTNPLDASDDVRRGAWTVRAPLPEARRSSTGAVLDGRFYVVGGSTPSSAAMVSYDPAADAWSPEPSPTGPYRGLAPAVAIDGRLYLVGGCESQPSSGPDCRIGTTGRLQMFDPATDAWTTLSPMPTPRHHFVTAEIDGKLYAAGGLGPCPPCPRLADLEVYDPATGVWTKKAPMSTRRAAPAGAAIDGKLYVAGGNEGQQAWSSMEVYDPSTDSWTPRASMPSALFLGAAGAIDGRLYVVPGYDATSTSVSTFFHYDASTDSWGSGPDIPTPRYAPAVGVLDGTLYVAGAGAGNSLITTVEAFTP